MDTTNNNQGRLARSRTMVRAAWRTLRADKELLALPALSSVISLLIIAVPAGIYGVLAAHYERAIEFNTSQLSTNPIYWLAILLVGFVLMIVTNYFSVALISGALARFRGQDPNLRSSLRVANSRLGSIVKFSFLQAVVGTILQFISERVPFGGRLIAWLGDFAWSVATLFSLPLIADREQGISPIDATKESVGILRKTWGESLVVNLGIALVAGLSTFAYLITSLMLVILAASVTGAAVAIGLGVIAFIGLLLLSLVFTALSAIAKTAIYYYATTGQAPAEFDRQVLQNTITQKQARRIFS